jgi:hypothetical protein
MRILATVAMITLCATSVAGQDAIYEASRIVLYSGLAFDLGTTEQNMRNGFIEGNPILGQNVYRRFAIATGATVGTDFLTKWLYKDHPRAAKIINFTVGGLHYGAGVYNVRLRIRFK